MDPFREEFERRHRENVQSMQEQALERVKGMPYLLALETLVEEIGESAEAAKQFAVDRPDLSTFVNAVAMTAFLEGLRMAATLAHDRAWQ